jgi:hypothetical protein
LKTAIFIDRPLLIAAIAKAEKDGPLANQNLLFRTVADIYNESVKGKKHEGKEIKAIQYGVVFLRVRDWGLTIKTPKGKKGRTGGVPLENRGKRVPKAQKFAQDPELQKSFADMRHELRLQGAQRFLPLVDKIEAGSRTAGLKLKCVQCACFQTKEVALCNVIGCGLFPFRPYKANKNGNIEVDEEVADVEVEAA